MREIKFRAWWRHSDGSAFELVEDINDRPISDLNESHFIIEQFTGLCDKNETPIFEGDIILAYGIQYRIEFIQDFMTYCPFTEEQWGWYKDGSNHFKYCYEESHQSEDSPLYFLSQLESYEIEIIGNIHQQPELLNTTEKMRGEG